MKKILLGALLLLSTTLFSQTIIDVKRDVTNYCKKSYDLFNPIEWSNYKLEYKKVGIDGNTIDSSILKSFTKFINGDTSTILINKLNNFQPSFNYGYKLDINENPIWLNTTKLGKITIQNIAYNYIISSTIPEYWVDINNVNHTNYNRDTLFFTKQNKNIVNKLGDTVKINWYLNENMIPKKIDYYINSYKIKLIYKALSKGGDVRIYSSTFIINYKINGQLSSVYEQ